MHVIVSRNAGVRSPDTQRLKLADVFMIQQGDLVSFRYSMSDADGHICIGAALAKENAKRALDGVLRRFPTLAIDGQAVPQDMELFSWLASLPVRARPL